ncbi:Protein LTV1-like protein [Zancudomyces culisetae]|uniref:Protein LTV1-like protein n=1 Tax=Zancudomyces culisetae TaxID=1213189 RepID=A0A1R1PUY7_ZANCU|nr:Protein LTV1-like protein [Zancudomyces culisetae]|eukprot:OMH84739.1 Protein LTV1-like protein [Zancudomyces culisetae]
MVRKKFIDKKKARQFTVLKRSVQDPLAFEEGVGPNVLQEVTSHHNKEKQDNYGEYSESEEYEDDDFVSKSLEDYDDFGVLEPKNKPQKGSKHGKNREEEENQGIFFDDTDYDYLQHLKPIGGGTEPSVFLEVSSSNNKKQKQKKSVSFALPDEVFESKHKMEIKGDAYPKGYQLDMDPELREVLEELEYNENEIEDEDDEDFFDMLRGDKPIDTDKYGKEQEDESDDYDENNEYGSDDQDEESIYKKIQRMKINSQQQGSDSEDDSGAEYGSEAESDAESGNYSRSNGYGNYRGGARSARSHLSMTSSVLHRNDKLKLLDEQFDQVEKLYADSDSESDDEDENAISKAAFDMVIDEFITSEKEKSGIQVGKEKTIVRNGVDLLKAVREAMLVSDSDEDDAKDSEKKRTQAKKQIIDTLDEESAAQSASNKHVYDSIKLSNAENETTSYRRPLWDVESIVSTYSNLHNHPTLIKNSYKNESKTRISVNKMGFPVISEESSDRNTTGMNGFQNNIHGNHSDDDEDDDQDEDDDDDDVNKGTGDRSASVRNKNETAEEKKARKKAIKDAKKLRIQEKKANRLNHQSINARKSQSRNDKLQYTVHLN